MDSHDSVQNCTTPNENINNSVNGTVLSTAASSLPIEPPSSLSTTIAESVSKVNPDFVVSTPIPEAITPFVPSLGAWTTPLKILVELKDPIPEEPPLGTHNPKSKACLISDILPPEMNENGQLRFSWAAKMDPKIRNLHRTTSPTYMEDGTPIVEIPNHVLMQGLENQKEYVIGQFYRCSLPSGGLIHAVANRIWGKKCKIFSRQLGEFSFLFHILDKSTRDWVLERGIWHFDDCLMFVAPWTPTKSLAIPEIATIPMWVTLKNIPACLYSEWGISWIASGLGEPMATDKPRLDPNLLGEAKLMVEVELDKAFPHRIAATDENGNMTMVQVLYSWIPSKCEGCGQLGHKKSRCLMLHQSTETVAAAVVSPTPTNISIRSHDLAIVKEPSSDHVLSSSPASLSGGHVATMAVMPSTPTANVNLSHLSPSIAAQNAIFSQETLAVTTACQTEQQLVCSSPTATATPSTIGISPNLVMLSSPSIGSLGNNEVVQGNVFGSNLLATLDTGDFSGYEMGVASQKTRGGRSIKPTQKVQEMQWTTVRGRGRKGRGGRVDHEQSC